MCADGRLSSNIASVASSSLMPADGSFAADAFL
jgi:hypothetical protein